VGEGWRLPLRERAVALALGPGAQRLAVGYRDGRVEVYAVGDAEPVLAVAPFTQRVGELVFDPNGRWLAASSWDGRARLLALAGSEAAAGNSR
jgi:WD40 repeat protein